VKYGFLILASALYGSCTHAVDTNYERKIIVVIPSYNNKEWFELNLGSVFAQKYSNYHVIYIDDCSPDGTGQLVEKYIKQMGQEHRVTLIQNKTRLRALANTYIALQMCDDDAIVMTYDGDDWFAHDQVFSMYNQIYSDSNIWITYGQFKNWPTGELGYCAPVSDEIVQKQWYRRKWWKPGQLRTFYGWLFKQVKLEDFIFEGPYWQGYYFPANADLAYAYPMMEMAGFHFKFVEDPIYIRNVQTPLNDFKANKEVQILGSAILRAKPVYPRLEKPLVGYFDRYNQRTADMVIFSHSPQVLPQLLISVDQYILGLNSIIVCYQALNNSDEQEYQLLQQKHSNIIFNKMSDSIDQLLTNLKRRSDHVLLAYDSEIFNGCVNISECVEWLERSFAYSFHLYLGQNKDTSIHSATFQEIPALNPINNKIYAWTYMFADGDWATHNNIAGSLYRTQQLLAQRKNMSKELTIKQFFIKWKTLSVDKLKLGLCFKHSKIAARLVNALMI